MGEFRLAQRGDFLEVSALAPRTSVDGVALERLAVLFLWGEGVSDLEKAGRRREVPAAPGERVVARLPAPLPGTLVRAAARATAGGDEGPRTLVLALTVQAPLEAPTGLRGQLEAGGVVLEWAGPVPDPVPPPDLGALGGPGARLPGALPRAGARPPAPGGAPGEPVGPARPAAASPEPEPDASRSPPGAEPVGGSEPSPRGPHGFNVYRRIDSAPYARPLTATPTLERSLTDSAPPLGQDACYTVRAVASAEPLIESAGSNEVCVAVRDVVPPAAPTGVAVLPREEGLEVVWSPSPEADLAGYRVYRQSGEGERERVGEVPTGTSTWVDAAAPPGVLHRYMVSAVDAAGNESLPSAPAEGRRR